MELFLDILLIPIVVFMLVTLFRVDCEYHKKVRALRRIPEVRIIHTPSPRKSTDSPDAGQSAAREATNAQAPSAAPGDSTD